MDEKRLPLTVCRRLQPLWQDFQKAQAAYGTAVGVALEMLGLDPNGDHNIDLDSGLVTVRQPPTPIESLNERLG